MLPKISHPNRSVLVIFKVFLPFIFAVRCHRYTKQAIFGARICVREGWGCFWPGWFCCSPLLAPPCFSKTPQTFPDRGVVGHFLRCITRDSSVVTHVCDLYFNMCHPVEFDNAWQQMILLTPPDAKRNMWKKHERCDEGWFDKARHSSSHRWCCRLLKQCCNLEICIVCWRWSWRRSLVEDLTITWRPIRSFKVLTLGGHSCCWGTGRPAQVKVRGEIRKGGQVDAGIWPSTIYLSKCSKTKHGFFYTNCNSPDNCWPYA